MSKEEVLEDLHDGVVEMDKEKTRESAERALEEGIEPIEAIMDGLVSGLNEVGDLFDEGEKFVPEVLMSSEALYAGLDVLKPHVDASDLGVEGKVIIGVAEGDVHDIGKNLVRLMFDVSGMEIVDLGKDVPNDQFVEKCVEEDADLIAVSAMMTSTMLAIEDIVKDARSNAPDAKILCGGAPISEKTAIEEFGADGYAPDATKAAKKALELMKE